MMGMSSMAPPRREQLDRLLALLADPQRAKAHIEDLKVAAERHAKAYAQLTRERAAFSREQDEANAGIAKERQALERDREAHGRDVAQRLAAADAKETAAAKLLERAEVLLAQRQTDADAAARLRAQLQQAVDRIAA
jgi:hypothetical protein